MERGVYARWNAPVSRTRVAHSLDYQAHVKLAHCNITEHVDDKTLEINATKARKLAADSLFPQLGLKFQRRLQG